jgi:hypothetical protein
MKKYVALLLLLLTHLFADAQVTLYPAPAGLPPSAEYTVTVNGKEAFMYASPVPAAYCSFDMRGPVEIVIKAARDIKWVDVRPATAGIKPVFKDSIIKLRLTKPVQLSIELNGSLRTPLFLFANAPEASKPSRTDPSIRYFESGKVHYAGLIELQSNESVYIEGGAVVVGAIRAKGEKNIKVFGRGVLDGTYNRNFNDSLIKAGPATAVLDSMKGKYQRTIEFIDCSNAVVDGITLHNSTTWQVVPVHCNTVLINNIKIVSDQASDDGIDVVQSRNVTIQHSFIRTKDDCIAIKAYMDSLKTEPVDSVLVQHCVFWNALWGNAVEIGFELNADEVKNITFRNCDIIHVEAGAAISIHNAGPGHVKNVVFDNIRIEDARQKLFDFAIFRSQYSGDGTRDPEERRRLYLNGAWDGVLMVPEKEKAAHAKYRGHISDVVLSNIHITDGLFPYSIFYGSDKDHKVRNVRVENLTVHGKKISRMESAKFYTENAENITLR